MRISQIIWVLFTSLCILMPGWADAESLADAKANALKLDRAARFLVPPRLNNQEVPAPGKNTQSPIMLRSPETNSPGNIIGNTHVDYQDENSFGRRIALGYPQTDYTHIVWLYQPAPLYWDPDMGINYQVYSDGLYNYTAGGILATGREYSCQASLAALGDNRAIIAFDHNRFISHAMVNFEYQPNLGVFIDYPLYVDSAEDWFESDMRSVCPSTETHFGTDTVVYALTKATASDFSNIGLLLYRKVGDSDFEFGQLIEARYAWPHVIVARQNTDSVAMVYIDRNLESGGEYSGRLSAVYRLSTDQGITWGPQINASHYTLDTMWHADTDISALWDDNGDLHMVWHSNERIDYNWYWAYRCRLLHWSTADELTTIISEARYEADCYSNFWDMNAGKMSVSQCEGKLYVLWAQYNDYDISDDCSDNGFANGELYMAASDDNGLTWDTAVNLTNTRTPGCLPGECESDIYPSMIPYGAEYPDAPDSLDIVYINDKDAGCIIYSQGTWTVNNVMHYRIPCRDVVHLPRMSVDPLEYDYPMIIDTGQTMDTGLTLTNIGNGALNWESTINYISGGEHNWLAMTPSTGYIDLAPLNVDSLTITFDSRNLPGNPSQWEAEIIISAVDYPGIVEPKTIPVSLIVASEDLRPREDTLETGCRSLIVYNTAKIGGQNPGYSLDIPGDCDTVDTYPDTDMYLYDASPVIAYVNGDDDTLAYTSIYNQEFMDDVTLRPTGNFVKISETDFETVQFTSVSTDSVFGLDVKYIAPTDNNCFIITKYDYYILGQEIIGDVHLGLIVDWDIPSDTLADNGSGFSEQLNTIWQYGAEYHDDNSGICNIPETDRLGGISVLQYAPINAWTEDNQAHQLDPAFDQKYLYSQMTGLTGYHPYSSVPSPPIDLHTGITFDIVDMIPGEKYTYYYAMVTTNQGEIDYLNQVAAAKNWAIVHTLPPSCMPGDANNDAQVNVGDAVYLISYIFKGGPPPIPYETCSGDANGDCQCNVGDAVYIISYVFKGGPAPVEFMDWYITCGSPAK